MPHILQPLPFETNELEPHLSVETLNFHHGKHHQAYVDKLNELLPSSGLENASLEEVVRRAHGPLFNNAAQHWNHSFMWQCLSPKGGSPQGSLAKALERSFGSFDEFRAKFTQQSIEVFGSGWTWLVPAADGRLEILQTSNADTPVREGRPPIFTADLWEHAYYIDYRNARPKYLEGLWSVVNWDFVAARLDEIERVPGARAAA